MRLISGHVIIATHKIVDAGGIFGADARRPEQGRRAFLLPEAGLERLLLGSEDDLPFYRLGQLSPMAASRIAQRYQWLAIGLVLGNVVTLLVVFVLALILLLGDRGNAWLVFALLGIATAQLGVAVWVWLLGGRAQQLPVQRLRADLGLSRHGDRLLIGGREFRLLGKLSAAPEVGQAISAYWVHPPLQRTPLALALLVEEGSP